MRKMWRMKDTGQLRETSELEISRQEFHQENLADENIAAENGR